MINYNIFIYLIRIVSLDKRKMWIKHFSAAILYLKNTKRRTTISKQRLCITKQYISTFKKERNNIKKENYSSLRALSTYIARDSFIFSM